MAQNSKREAKSAAKISPSNDAAEMVEIEASGLRWVKFSGIGPPRQRKGAAEGQSRLSGEDITSLGSLEAELMSILWDIGQPAASMDVMEQSLYKRRAQGQEPVSFATIATTLRRLTDKGVIITHKNKQGTPVYLPTVAREEMAARILNNVSVTLLGQSLYSLLPQLLNGLQSETLQSEILQTGSEAEPPNAAKNRVNVARLMQALEEEKTKTERGTETWKDASTPAQI